MNAVQTYKRRTRTQPFLEHLDMRIAPTAVSAAAALTAALKIEARQVARWETALATATPGSHHQQVLLNHISRTEQRMGLQEARLARIQARALARIHVSPKLIVKGQPPTSFPPVPVFMPHVVAPSAPVSDS